MGKRKKNKEKDVQVSMEVEKQTTQRNKQTVLEEQVSQT